MTIQSLTRVISESGKIILGVFAGLFRYPFVLISLFDQRIEYNEHDIQSRDGTVQGHWTMRWP
jgi:hypothetical protein